MGKVPQPNIVWRGAHPNNFTIGRPGAGRDGRNGFHHVVGSAESAVAIFNAGTRQVSSHLVITDRADVAAWQCVDFNNTAYTDGNWESNLRSITMEHHGDWRNGYRNEQVIENSARIVAWLRDQGLVNRFYRHREVSLTGTVCPADLVVEEIWNRASDIINQYNNPTPPPQPEWLRNRGEVGEKTVYSHKEGLFIYNLNDGQSPADTRRFPVNQNFTIKGQTTVGGREFWITKSSYEANNSNGILKSEVKDQMWTPAPVPVPPIPTTPDWADAVVDTANKTMYVLRDTPLIDLENGRPYIDKKGNEVWYKAGDIIFDVSAHTVVSEVTYQLTEYSFKEIEGKRYANANGIKSSDLTIDPLATPPGTPANPIPPTTTTTTTEGTTTTTTEPQGTTTTSTTLEPEPPTTTTTTTDSSPTKPEWTAAVVAAVLAAIAILWGIITR